MRVFYGLGKIILLRVRDRTPAGLSQCPLDTLRVGTSLRRTYAQGFGSLWEHRLKIVEKSSLKAENITHILYFLSRFKLGNFCRTPELIVESLFYSRK